MAPVNHTINVSIVDVAGVQSVQAIPNPLPFKAATPPFIVVSPGDTITWILGPTVTEELQVLFQSFGDFPDLIPQPSNPLGPLSSIALGFKQISATIRPDVPQAIEQSRRFFYKLLRNGKPLPWVQPLPEGAPDEFNGGVIDTPRTPP